MTIAIQAAIIIAKSLHYTPLINESAQRIIDNSVESCGPMTGQQIEIIKEMLKLAESVGIDTSNIVLPAIIEKIEAIAQEEDGEVSDEELDDMIKDINDWEDVIDEYEPGELVMIDDETGEELDGLDEDMNESELNEILSRAERIKSRMRFARTSGKRLRAVKIALRRHSSNAKINSKARRMAIKLMKKRLSRGKSIASMGFAEKSRIERIIVARSKVIGRLALKLTSRIRTIEKNRLTHRTTR